MCSLVRSLLNSLSFCEKDGKKRVLTGWALALLLNSLSGQMKPLSVKA